MYQKGEGRGRLISPERIGGEKGKVEEEGKERRRDEQVERNRTSEQLCEIRGDDGDFDEDVDRVEGSPSVAVHQTNQKRVRS